MKRHSNSTTEGYTKKVRYDSSGVALARTSDKPPSRASLCEDEWSLILSFINGSELLGSHVRVCRGWYRCVFERVFVLI